MKPVLLGTKNKGKIKELGEFLKDLPIEVLSLSDVGIEDDIEETGESYYENSKLKALYYAEKSGLPTLADDGGLEIEALGGAPGIKSRRWLGFEATDEELIQYMIKVARELPDDNRGAYFKVVNTFAFPNGKVFDVYSDVKGIIAKEPHMKLLQGYPYRSFFFIPELNKYYHESEMTEDELKTYNHRYKSIQEMKKIIKRELDL